MTNGAIHEPSRMEQIGYYALLMYLFFYTGRVLEIVAPSLRLLFLLNAAFLLVALVSGRAFTLLKSKLGPLMIAFTAWTGFSLLFSVWKSGSIPYVTDTVRSLVILAAMAGLITTTRWCLQVMHAIGLGMAIASLLGLWINDRSVAGRLAITSSGTLGDPNYFCLYLLAGLPFLWLVAKNASNVVVKLGALGLAAPVLAACVATGSRSGLLALAAMLGVLFLRSPAAHKLKIVAATGIFVVMASLFFSSYLINRFVTFFDAGYVEELSPDENALLSEVAVSSAESRKYLFFKSLELTLRNPILGVGPGMFAVAEADDAKLEGRRGNWHTPHNTYTQLSSEIGIPGLIFFAGALLYCLALLSGMLKLKPAGNREEWEKVRNGALYLQLSLIGTMTGAFFLSLPYGGLLFVQMGLTVAMANAVRREFAVARVQARPQPVTAPAPEPPSPQAEPERRYLGRALRSAGRR